MVALRFAFAGVLVCLSGCSIDDHPSSPTVASTVRPSSTPSVLMPAPATRTPSPPPRSTPTCTPSSPNCTGPEEEEACTDNSRCSCYCITHTPTPQPPTPHPSPTITDVPPAEASCCQGSGGCRNVRPYVGRCLTSEVGFSGNWVCESTTGTCEVPTAGSTETVTPTPTPTRTCGSAQPRTCTPGQAEVCEEQRCHQNCSCAPFTPTDTATRTRTPTPGEHVGGCCDFFGRQPCYELVYGQDAARCMYTDGGFPTDARCNSETGLCELR